MRIICEIYPADIADIASWRLEQLCVERAENIEELQTLIVVFRQRVAAKEEHSPLFRDNLTAILLSIEDLEESCAQWQREIEAMKIELENRQGGGGGNTIMAARVANYCTKKNYSSPA